MATSTTGITALYEDVVASLIPHYDNFVLLPGEGVLVNTYDISGAVGNTVKVPVVNAWSAGAEVGEGNSIIAASAQDFAPGSIQVAVTKKGAGTYVTEESLEDGGLATVRQQVITRLSRSLAQSTDTAGMNILLSGSAAALTDIANVDLSIDSGLSNVDLTSADVSVVLSPEALAYAMKREPTVKMWNDVDRDRYEMVASVRNGFGRVPFSTAGGNVFFARAITASGTIGESNANIRASLDMFSTSVANLRADNAPTDAGGFYLAVVTPAHEFHLASQLNSVNVGSGAIGDLSMIGNQALLDGLIGQSVGCRFIRSNNLPRGIASA